MTSCTRVKNFAFWKVSVKLRGWKVSLSEKWMLSMKKMTFIVWQCLKSTRTSEYLSGYLKWLLVMRSFLLLVDTKHRGARFQLSQNKCVRNHPPKNDTLNFSWLTYTQGKMLTFVLKCRAYISAMGGRLTIDIEAFCMHEHFSARIWPQSQITETHIFPPWEEDSLLILMPSVCMNIFLHESDR